MPRFATYQRMIAAYEPIWRNAAKRAPRGRDLLSADELREIADADVHPTRRRGTSAG
jgi:hypothetical protein